MFNINFNKPFIKNDLQNYVKKVNENSIKKITETFNKNNTLKKNKMIKQHISDYDFCDISKTYKDNYDEYDEYDEYDDCKKIIKKKEIINAKNISFILAFLGGSSIISLSLLYYYNIYIKK